MSSRLTGYMFYAACASAVVVAVCHALVIIVAWRVVSGMATPTTAPDGSQPLLPLAPPADLSAPIANLHRDTCAATREPRVQLAQDQAKAWLSVLQENPSKARAFMTVHADWKTLPLSAYPSGIGSVDTCQDEDAKVGLDTTPPLGDGAALGKLVKWHR